VDQWRHLVIAKSVLSGRSIVPPMNVYIIFHVYEYPTEHTARFLTMDATATWLVSG